MLPVLFENEHFSLYSYGAMISLGFLVALLVALKLSKANQVSSKHVWRMCILALFSGVISSKALFLVMNFSSFLDNPSGYLFPLSYGLIFYGGLIGAVFSLFVYVQLNKLSAWKVGDTLLPALVLGHLFGRIGCFLAGCCYGAKTDAHFGVAMNIFSEGETFVHAVQLYEAAGLLCIFLSMIFIRKKFPIEGLLMFTYFGLYSGLRFLMEFFRGDTIRGLWFEGMISTSQIISLVIFSIITVLGIYRYSFSKTLRYEEAK